MRSTSRCRTSSSNPPNTSSSRSPKSMPSGPPNTRAIEHADRVYVLRTGRIELAGRSEELRRSADLEEAYFGFADDAGSAPG